MVEVPLHLSMKMKRNVPRSSHQDEKCKSSRSEDYEASRSRTEEEKMQRRREWMLQQEREREHERLKKKMILEYEMKRAREKGLPAPKHSTPSCSKSRSKSPRSQPRRTSTSTSTSKKAPVLSERLESLDGTVPIFKGPEGTQISANELRRIKVDIHRNIPGESKDTELQRDIINPEDVVVKRREGEGSKPIFERDEIKGTSEEIEERRTVVSVNNENLEGKSKTFKKRSTSLSPVRTRSHSPRRTSSRHSRHEDSRHEDRGSCRSNRERQSRDGNSYREDRRRTQLYSIEEERNRRSRRDHSHSRERDQRKWDKDSRHRDGRSYRECRERSRERSRERRDRDRSRERRVPPQHYIEQIPVPIYYGNFPPRPIMMGPLVPIRGQVPLGSNRHPTMIGPLRGPFPPRFIPSDMYRLRSPQNPRFGPMF
ncbi:feminizer isoform X1 [Nomia melanderi]|uniref:feminizer isoform X1 n=1 Tax=Nomia melanderi TaxID=2448451 RepID=UPI0013044036|nr:female-specific protein transformer-like isoform X1 [Nomia melanderi]